MATYRVIYSREGDLERRRCPCWRIIATALPLAEAKRIAREHGAVGRYDQRGEVWVRSVRGQPDAGLWIERDDPLGR